MGNQVSNDAMAAGQLSRKQGGAGPAPTAVTISKEFTLQNLVPLRDGLGLMVLPSNTEPLADRWAAPAGACHGAGMQVGKVRCISGRASCQVVWDLDISGLPGAQQGVARMLTGSSSTFLTSPPFQLPAQLLHHAASKSPLTDWQSLHPQGFSATSPLSPAPGSKPSSAAPAGDVLVISRLQELSVGGGKPGMNDQDDWHFVWCSYVGTDSHVSLQLLPTSQQPSFAVFTTPSQVLVQGMRDGQLNVQHTEHLLQVDSTHADPRLLHRSDAGHLLSTCDSLRVTWTIPSISNTSKADHHQEFVAAGGRLTSTPATQVPASFPHSSAHPTSSSSSTSTSSSPPLFTRSASPAGLASPLRILVASLSPRILLVDNFLEPQLCEALMQLAAPRLVRSRVSTGTETPSRTSRGTFFTGAAALHEIIQQVEERMAGLVHHAAVVSGKKPLVPSEALQVVAYGPGDFYTEHYDNKAGGLVTRHATILVYLNDCEEGGGTFFSKATATPTDQDLDLACSTEDVAQLTQVLHNDGHVKRPGVRVLPVQGRAILFWSALPNGSEDLASLHSAEVVKKGQKWITTRWYKEAA